MRATTAEPPVPPGPDRPGETVPPSPGRPDAHPAVTDYPPEKVEDEPEETEAEEDAAEEAPEEAPVQLKTAPKVELTEEQVRRLEAMPHP